MRVAEADCSFLSVSPLEDARCYVHGYVSFFDFKEAFGQFIFQSNIATAQHRLLRDVDEFVFTSGYRAENGEGGFSVVFASELYLHR